MPEKKPSTVKEVGFAVQHQEDLTPLNSPNLSLNINSYESQKRFTIHRLETEVDVTDFSVANEDQQLLAYVKRKWKEIFAPIKRSESFGKILIISILYTLRIFVLIRDMLKRGWRLEIVRRVGLKQEDYVPNSDFTDLLKYLKEGLVLIIMRSIYFLPHLIFISFTSSRLFSTAKNLFFWIFQRFLNGKQQGIIEYFLTEVIPELTFDLIMQFVILTLYMIIIWPIYRITMIKYALGIIKGRQFLSFTVFKDSAKIYRSASDEVLGIYFFTFFVDFFVFVLLTFVIFIPVLGILVFLFMNPTINLLFRHWPKGYAYGILAQKFIEKGLISLPNARNINPSINPVADTLPTS